MVNASCRQFWLAGLLLLIASLSGCQQRAANKLLGKWEGRPDTAAARSERESLKYGATSSEATPKTSEQEIVTDWESYDLTVSLDFSDLQQLEMALSDGSSPIAGGWRVVSTSPIGCTIEVETDGESKEGEETPSKVRRQFQIDFEERESGTAGFTMMEVGADRRLGMLYFTRPGK